MIIPEKNTRNSVGGHAPFIKRMIQLNAPFIAGYQFGPVNLFEGVMRFKYKNQWINYISIRESYDAGIVPYLLENMTGHFIFGENEARLYNKIHTHREIVFSKYKYFYSTMDIIHRSIEGEGFSPTDLSVRDYEYIDVRSLKKVTQFFFKRYIPREIIPKDFPNAQKEFRVISGTIKYKPRALYREEAIANLEQLKDCIRDSWMPLSLISKPDDEYLLKTGWKKVHPCSNLYIPTDVES